MELRPDERLDDLQTGGLRLIQKPGTFCFGTDSVLLADFAAPRRRERAADLGCGNGAIALLLAGHRPDLTVDAVEIQPEMADMAARSVRLNGLEARIRVHCGDMRAAWKAIGREACSLAVCNPPYGAQGRTLASAGEAERIARHEVDLTPEDVAASASAILKYGGRFCAVYPAQRAPKLVLIEGVKGGGRGLNWLAPLILYDSDGSTSAEWRRIYGVGASEA